MMQQDYEQRALDILQRGAEAVSWPYKIRNIKQKESKAERLAKTYHPSLEDLETELSLRLEIAVMHEANGKAEIAAHVYERAAKAAWKRSEKQPTLLTALLRERAVRNHLSEGVHPNHRAKHKREAAHELLKAASIYQALGEREKATALGRESLNLFTDVGMSQRNLPHYAQNIIRELTPLLG